MERIKRALILVQSHGAVSGDDGYRAQCSREVTGGSLSWCENSQLNCERLGHFSSLNFLFWEKHELQTSDLWLRNDSGAQRRGIRRKLLSWKHFNVVWGDFLGATIHFKNSKSYQAFCLIFIYISWFHVITVYCITLLLLIDIMTIKGIKTEVYSWLYYNSTAAQSWLD